MRNTPVFGGDARWAVWLCTALLAALFILAPATGAGARMVTDQLGRNVEVPERAERMVVLMHHALDILLELGAGDQIVGVLQEWPAQIPDAATIMPGLRNLPTPGGLSTVNIEALLALKPDLVIQTHYAPAAVRERIEQAGVPVIALSLYRADKEQAARLNPALTDPDVAYTEGMREGVRLLGDVAGHKDKAEQLLKTIDSNRNLLAAPLADLPESARPTCLMLYPDLFTMGTGKYSGVIMERAGGRNVAAALNGYTKVSMEHILGWNPAVIFIQDRHASLADLIRADPAWKTVDAVKNGRIHVTPSWVKPWGHPTPESMALGELWTAKALHPDRLKDVPLEALVAEFFTTFYGVPVRD